MELLDIFTGGGIGAAVGAVASSVEKYFTRKAEAVAKREDNRHIEAMQSRQHQFDALMAEKDLLGEQIEADSATLIASYNHDSSFENTSPWVANIRALVRPLSVAGTGILAIWHPEFFASFMMTLTWYFSSRTRSAPPLRG